MEKKGDYKLSPIFNTPLKISLCKFRILGSSADVARKREESSNAA